MWCRFLLGTKVDKGDGLYGSLLLHVYGCHRLDDVWLWRRRVVLQSYGDVGDFDVEDHAGAYYTFAFAGGGGAARAGAS